MPSLSKIANDYNLIMIELTNCCNLNCDYCYRNSMRIKKKMLSKDEYLLRLTRIKGNAEILFCGMGEQLTHPMFYDFVELANEHMLQVVTNGTIKIDVDRLSLLPNVRSFTFSVDGPTEEIARKSCKQYSFATLLDNLSSLKKLSKIQTAINFVMNDYNVNSLIEMASLCELYGVGTLNLLLPTTNLKWVRSNYDIIYELLGKLKKHVQDNNYLLSLNMPDKMYCLYNGLVTPYISVEGYVRPCCSHDREVKVVGKIQDNEIASIMKADAWRSFVDKYDCKKCSMNQYNFTF